MKSGSLMLCSSFLVVVIAAAIVSCQGSRSDVRQKLRSEVVYSERNHKEGRYKYGYAVKKGETQFHHQRSLDGAMYGCYGYVDPTGKLFITHYLADMAGYRLVNMANPDRKLAERIRNLGTAENPIGLQHLFPVECREDGDIKTLQETADAMKASMAEAGDQTAAYKSRSSSFSVSGGRQDSTVRGSLVSSGGATRNSARFQQTSKTVESSEGSKLQEVKSNQKSQNKLGFKGSQTSEASFNQQSNVQQTSEDKGSTVISYKTNVNKESSLGKTAVRTVGSVEPKFVMKSTSKDSSIRLAGSTLNLVGKSTDASQTMNTEQSVEQDSKTATATKTIGSNVVNQATEDQKTTASEATKLSSSAVEGTASKAAYNTNGIKEKITQEHGSYDAKGISGTVETSVASGSAKKLELEDSDKEAKITEKVKGHTNTEGLTKTSQTDKVEEVAKEQVSEERAVTSKESAEFLKNSQASEYSKFETMQQSFGTSSSSVTAGGSVKTMQSSNSEKVNKQVTEIGVTGQASGLQQESKETESKSIVDEQQSSGTLESLKTSTKSDAANTVDSKVNAETSKVTADSAKITGKTEIAEASIAAISGEYTEDQLVGTVVRKGAKIRLLGEGDQIDSADQHSQENYAGSADSMGVKMLNREFLAIGEHQDIKSEQKSVEENSESVRSEVTGTTQASRSAQTDSNAGSNVSTNKADFFGIEEYQAIKSGHESVEGKVESVGFEATGHTETSKSTQTESKLGDEVSINKVDATVSVNHATKSTKSESEVETGTLTSKADVKQTLESVATDSKQKATSGSLDREAMKSTVSQQGNVDMADVAKASASRTNLNIKEQSVQAEAANAAVNSYEGINLRFDDEDVENHSKTSSVGMQSSSSKASDVSAANQGTSSSQASSGMYRGTVKYADYASGANHVSEQSKGIKDVKTVEQKSHVSEESLKYNVAKNLRRGSNLNAQQNNKISEVRVQQRATVQREDQVSSEQNVAWYTDKSKGINSVEVQQGAEASLVQNEEKNLRGETALKEELDDQSKEINGLKTMDVQQKSQISEAGVQQGTQVQQESQVTVEQNVPKSTDQSSQVTIELNGANKRGGSTFKQEGITTNNRKGAVKVAEYIKDSTAEGASKQVDLATQAESLMQSNDESTKQQADQLKASKESESNSGRSFNQAKQEQQSSIIRFAIPGIIQQGPPIQGRRSFVGLPINSLNNLFPTNSQSRVGAVPAAEDDDPRLEGPRLPATPRTTTPASPEAATVSYHHGVSVTDRVPVTPRPTTNFRPLTPGFPATTAKSLLARTTVGPSGDIYDEIEEELELGQRPTLMSPQIPEQKPSISGGGVTVIPSVGQGVVVEQPPSGPPLCYEVTLQIPADARQIFVRTNAPEFRVYGDGDPNERIRLVEPGVYEVNLGATSGIQFNRYQTGEDPWKRSNNNNNKLRLDVDRNNFDYGELVQKPLYSRTQTTTSGDQQARLNNPYLPLVPVAPAEARHLEAEPTEQVLTPEQRSLLSLVPSWKKVLLYY